MISGATGGKNLEPLIEAANWFVETPNERLIESIKAPPQRGTPTSYKF